MIIVSISELTPPSPHGTARQIRAPQGGKSMWKGLFYGILWSFATLVSSVAAEPNIGARVTLGWDANAEEVAGYKLHYGFASGDYGESVDAGQSTTYTLNNLTPGVTYFFALTAYNSDGIESDFSNEVTFTAVPAVLSIQNMDPADVPGSGGPTTRVSQMRQAADGYYTFVLSAPAGTALAIHASSDLKTWMLLGTVENPTGAMSVSDLDAGNQERRFYKVLQVLPAGSP